MSDVDLEKLKRLATPPPSEGARARARVAALDSFNQTTAIQKDHSTATQESEANHRLMHIDPENKRRSFMRLSVSRSTFTVAASIAAVAVAIPLAMRLSSNEALAPPRNSQVATIDGIDKPKAPAVSSAPIIVPRQEANTSHAESTRTALLYRREAAKKLLQRDGEKRANEQLSSHLKPIYTSPNTRVASSNRSDLHAAADRRIEEPARSRPRVGQSLALLSQQFGGTYAVNADRLPNAGPRYKGRDQFESITINPLKSVATEPVSTFSADVDTASYGFVRRTLNAGRLPQANAVRVEELINYFGYNYAPPESRDKPFRPHVQVMPSPWNPYTKLMHVAIKGYSLKALERPRANLVFLIDVSGSMMGPDRLPLLQNAFRMLLDSLKPDDTVGLVTYASGSGIALEPTKVSERAKIIAAINGLRAGGSTSGASGIQDAYTLVEASFDEDAVNRVILGTDGDFNVGITNRDELKSYIATKRKSGIFLSILGVGEGNYNDALMQTLAQNGNGTATYIDTIGEARKVLVEEASSTLFPIAKDVKFQIEFNPARVSHYRLIGYETRALNREDFRNDKVDAGDVGSGHSVTAIYEITPVGAEQKLVEKLRYQAAKTPAPAEQPDEDAEFAFLRIRYKLPESKKSKQIALAVMPERNIGSVDAVSPDIRFSIAVAAFGQILQGGAFTGEFGYDDVIALASGAKGADPFGIRAEFINLVRLAKSAR